MSHPRSPNVVAGGAARSGGASSSARPFPTYPGGKGAAGSVQQITSRFPAHAVYVEPFIGNGTILRNKRPALRTIGIDSNPVVIDRWRDLAWPGLELICGDGIDWLQHAGAWLPADALVYADPPYPLDTRTHRHLYREELTELDHLHLVTWLRELPCSVFVSSYANDLYAWAFRGWQHTQWTAMTRGGPRQEHLWWRLSLPAFTDNPDAVGRDYRERERIKKKVRRWRNNFAAMSRGERHALLHALLQAEHESAAGPSDVSGGGICNPPAAGIADDGRYHTTADVDADVRTAAPGDDRGHRQERRSEISPPPPEGTRP